MLGEIFLLDPKMRMYYYVFVFMLLIVLLLRNPKIITQEYTKINRKIWLMLLIITIFGFMIRLEFALMQPITDVSVWSHRQATISISEHQQIQPTLHTRGYSLLVSPIYS